jgi:SSS family solute:Na+ symporter
VNLKLIDWSIILVVFAVVAVFAWKTKKYMKSVADFLSANRCADRYLLATAEGAANSSVVSFVGCFEMYYKAGFSIVWWGLIFLMVRIAIALSGWIVYRFRQTRALTLAQFLEVRYSQKFRIVAGIIAFLSGIINFGIFPAVASRFFIYFCGLPESFSFLGVNISTFALNMIVLLAISLFLTFLGGQITVMVTDFLQGAFVNIVLIAILVYILSIMNWPLISSTLAKAPENSSLMHPFRTADVSDFNVWYYLIGAFGMFYTQLAWQGSQGFNSAARTAHEARMGKTLGAMREMSFTLLVLIMPISAYVIMNCPVFSLTAQNVNSVLGTISDKTIQTQMLVPISLSKVLPAGLMGALCAAMMAAFVSTNNSYMHSWASIFIQDVVLPLRKKPISSSEHIRFLRLSMVGVSLFIFIFSLLFTQKTYINMFFAITGAIWLGGAGSVIIGGLYWKRGTTAAAYAALFTGSILAVGGIVLEQIWPRFHNGFAFPINGQWMWLIAIISSIVIYVIVSLLSCREFFDMDRLLNRGKYLIKSDTAVQDAAPVSGFKALVGITEEFSKGDKLIYYGLLLWTFLWAGIFTCGTIYNFIFNVSTDSWARFWHLYVLLAFTIGVVTTVWFSLGGISDLRKLFKTLSNIKRDDMDDGRVMHANQINKSTANVLSEKTSIKI